MCWKCDNPGGTTEEYLAELRQYPPYLPARLSKWSRSITPDAIFGDEVMALQGGMG